MSGTASLLQGWKSEIFQRYFPRFASLSRFAWSTACAIVALGLGLALTKTGLGRVQLLLGLGGCYIALLAVGSLVPGLDFYLRAARRGAVDRPWVALTFDDGPDPDTTPLLLDLLRRKRVSAAFFFVGESARRYPALVAQAVADGHLIGNHSDRHGYDWTIGSTERLFTEFANANHTLTAIVGEAPRFVRTPAGVSRPKLAGVLQRLNLRNVAWDVRGLEGLYRDPERIAARIARRTRNGSIILLHERYYGVRRFDPQQVVTAAQRTVERLRERGFEFVRLDRLLERSADHEALSSERCSPLAGGSLPVEDRVGEPTDRRAA